MTTGSSGVFDVLAVSKKRRKQARKAAAAEAEQKEKQPEVRADVPTSGDSAWSDVVRRRQLARASPDVPKPAQACCSDVDSFSCCPPPHDTRVAARRPRPLQRIQAAAASTATPRAASGGKRRRSAHSDVLRSKTVLIPGPDTGATPDDVDEDGWALMQHPEDEWELLSHWPSMPSAKVSIPAGQW
eukprot:TRINITY_DN3761_c0_g4_i2.p2 TRINITY_DN3761_c0_g4~~TRINITY_DN3761_c0_g4_i2.p2  ORF type:complete len:186 (+),score=48.90 TRINITY_DN3761_c0_g4_i2:113-670(+)